MNWVHPIPRRWGGIFGGENPYDRELEVIYPKISRMGLPDVRERETPELSAAKFKGMPMACSTVAWMSCGWTGLLSG